MDGWMNESNDQSNNQLVNQSLNESINKSSLSTRIKPIVPRRMATAMEQKIPVRISFFTSALSRVRLTFPVAKPLNEKKKNTKINTKNELKKVKYSVCIDHDAMLCQHIISCCHSGMTTRSDGLITGSQNQSFSSHVLFPCPRI